jgi:hypothetical protein
VSVGLRGLNSVLCFNVQENLHAKAFGGDVFMRLSVFINLQSNFDTSWPRNCIPKTVINSFPILYNVTLKNYSTFNS